MPTMKGKDLVKLLKRNGWREVNISGSHHIMRKGKQTLSVPVHTKDMKIGILNFLLRSAGLPTLH